MLADFSIISWPFRIGMIVVTVGVVTAAVFLAHRWWARLTLGAVALVLVVATVAAFVNAYDAYIPTFDGPARPRRARRGTALGPEDGRGP